MGAPRGPQHFFSIMILKHEQNTIIWSKKVFSSIARLLLVICKYAKMSHNAPPHPIESRARDKKAFHHFHAKSPSRKMSFCFTVCVSYLTPGYICYGLRMCDSGKNSRNTFRGEVERGNGTMQEAGKEKAKGKQKQETEPCKSRGRKRKGKRKTETGN